MKSKPLYRKENQFMRVLKVQEDRVFVIDCVKRLIPKWEDENCLEGFVECEEQELLDYLGKSFEEPEEMSEKDRMVMHERFQMIYGAVTFSHNSFLRNEAINVIEEEYGISRNTIKHYLCEYLAFSDIRALAPKKREEKVLTDDEKNMRWALNKFYYNINRNSLKTAYTLMLKNKYCDAEGKLLENYPSYYQFRYFFRKTKNQQKFYISREGLAVYQRDYRPLLGEGVREYAPCIGIAMLDSTVCDIYLVNEANQIVGRPLLSVCVDAYSGICMGYSLTWEGGMYSLRNLMLNVISDKREHCRKFGISISKDEWNVSELPLRMITDKGSEYKSENFEQLSELGISIVNLPPYRPELKGPVEKFFDCVQGYFKPYLKGKGIVEPDFGERGKRDYRKDASLTMEQFEKVLIHCILFYNSKRILKDFPFSEEMLSEHIRPYSNTIWNMQKEQGTELISVNKEELVKVLLPRTNGKFKRNGLLVNGLRYKNDNYNEAYLQGKEVVVAYNADDVSQVWLLENGSFVSFDLIESRFKDKQLENVNALKTKQNQLCREEQRNVTQAEIELAEKILTVRSQTVRSTDVKMKNIRDTRKKEQRNSHKDFVKGVV